MGFQGRNMMQSRCPKAPPTECAPADCRWFSAEDACVHALAAYYAAEEATHPPAGEPFVCDEGSRWSSRSDFAVNFLMAFATRLHKHAQQSGHPFAIQISTAGSL